MGFNGILEGFDGGAVSFGARTSGFVSNTVPLDSDAQAYIDAAGITDEDEQTAVNTLVLALKENNNLIWDKCPTIRPISPTSLSAATFNLKDPDLYRIVWINNPAHAVTGMTGDGSTSYGDSNFPLSNLTASNSGSTVYLRDNIDAVEIPFGAIATNSSGLFWQIPFFSGTNYRSQINNALNFTSATTGQGCFTAVRTGSTGTAYRNGVQIVTGTQGGGTAWDNDAFLLCRNNQGTADTFYSGETAFFATHEFLTATETSDFYDAIQAYQVSLNRNV